MELYTQTSLQILSARTRLSIIENLSCGFIWNTTEWFVPRILQRDIHVSEFCRVGVGWTGWRPYLLCGRLTQDAFRKSPAVPTRAKVRLQTKKPVVYRPIRIGQVWRAYEAFFRQVHALARHLLVSCLYRAIQPVHQGSWRNWRRL